MQYIIANILMQKFNFYSQAILIYIMHSITFNIKKSLGSR